MGRTIYVAGGSSERTEASVAIVSLREGGWHVTHDWTPEDTYSRPPSECASDCVSGVFAASFFWLRIPRDKSEGSGAELGMAIAVKRMSIALRRPRAIIVSGRRRCIFPQSADVDLHFAEHEQALKWLLEYAP